MIEPLRLSYEVACPAAHAFDVWTTRLSTWWPKGHSTSGDPATTVVLEPRLGGRTFERLGAGGGAYRDANTRGWGALVPSFVAAAETSPGR